MVVKNLGEIAMRKAKVDSIAKLQHKIFDLFHEIECKQVVIERQQKEINELKKFKMFYDHIKQHFKKEHPDWKVMCKICGKTFDEIVKEMVRNE